MRKKSIYLPCTVFLAISILLLLFLPSAIPSSPLSGAGARMFPTFVLVSIAVLSLILIVQEYIKERKNKEEKATEAASSKIEGILNNKQLQRVWLSCLIIILYLFLFNKIGFLASSILCTTLLLLLFRMRKLTAFGVVYLSIVVIYLIFTKLLFVQLP